jgi:hypothetical protein
MDPERRSILTGLAASIGSSQNGSKQAPLPFFRSRLQGLKLEMQEGILGCDASPWAPLQQTTPEQERLHLILEGIG